MLLLLTRPSTDYAGLGTLRVTFAGRRPRRGQLSYASSNGGVASATRALAIELAEYGITVNYLAPG
jgi:NAD(P)-dependent dehydrogenase (short-subunit alcohol dehydrogenase family)